MRVVIFWAMCHHSLGHEKKALLTVFETYNPATPNRKKKKFSSLDEI